MNFDPVTKKMQLDARYKWLIGGVAAIVVSPVIFLAVKGMVGLACAFAVGTVITQLAPVFSLRLANWRVKLLIQAIEANPIETMINLRIEKEEELNKAGKEIVDFETAVRNYDDQVKDFSQTDPDEVAAFQEIADKMEEALRSMKQNRADAQTALELLISKIGKAERIYKMSLEAQKVTALSKTAEAKVFQEIKERVAFDTVRTQLNRAFASLSEAVDRRKQINMQVKSLPKMSESPA